MRRQYEQYKPELSKFCVNNKLYKVATGCIATSGRLGHKMQSFAPLITRPIMHQPTNSTLPQPPLDSATPISYMVMDISAIGGHLPYDLDL